MMLTGWFGLMPRREESFAPSALPGATSRESVPRLGGPSRSSSRVPLLTDSGEHGLTSHFWKDLRCAIWNPNRVFGASTPYEPS